MTSRSTGANKSWFNRVLDLFSALFLGQPSAKRLSFDPNLTKISMKQDRLSAPASLLGAGGPAIVPINKTMLVDVVLPPDILLTRSITVPKSARGKIAEIAALDLRRKTPFKVAEVYTVTSLEDDVGTELSVTQRLIKRTEVDAIVLRLNNVGFRVRKVLVDAGANSPTLVNQTASVAPYAKGWQRVNIGLLATVGLLSLVFWLFPGWQSQRAITNLEPVLVEKRAEVVAMRRELEERNASATKTERFLHAVVRHPRMIEVLRSLTVALPDEVWLSDLVLRRGQLVLSGETAGSATDLVLALAKTKEFANPRLSGPVSRTATGGERFQIALSAGMP